MLLLIAILAVAEPSRDDLSAMYAEMHDLRAECAEFRLDDGSFPPIDEIFPRGVPTDLWDNPYALTPAGHIRSRGANGIRENGVGDDWGTDLAPPVPIDHPGDQRFLLMIAGAGLGVLVIAYFVIRAMARTGYVSRDVGGSI